SLILFVFTHSVGVGRRAGLCQMNCWHSTRFAWFLKAKRASRPSVDIDGRPGSQALPSSITIEPLGFRNCRNIGANSASQVRYSCPVLFPYRFLRLSGNGGEVRMSETLPR